MGSYRLKKMLQIIGLLLISWAILHFFFNESVLVLGFVPTYKTYLYFAILLVTAAFFSSSTYFLKMYFTLEQYKWNTSISFSGVLWEIGNQIRTVLTEELICRGALLYFLLRKIGPKKGILLSALIFALLHWLNGNLWGDWISMGLLFLFTFCMGFLLAYSFYKSGSILLPFAIHFGWNIVQNFIFPNEVSSFSLFKLANNPPSVTISYFSFFTLLFFPKIAVILSNYLIVKTFPQKTY